MFVTQQSVKLLEENVVYLVPLTTLIALVMRVAHSTPARVQFEVRYCCDLALTNAKLFHRRSQEKPAKHTEHTGSG